MTAMGYQDYYTCLYDDPAFIHEFQGIVAGFCLRELEMALRYPVDAVQVSAVFCSSTGPLLSREMIEEFEYPSLRQRIGIIRERGRVVSLHADGNFSAFVPDFIDMGVDVINPVEPCHGAQDIYALKAQYGDRIAWHGNIDLAGVLVHGSPEDVARDVAEHIVRLAPGGGYIVASSHNITEAVPLANFLAMRDAVHQYRGR
jgi:uroporphyrinogen decarboxylase